MEVDVRACRLQGSLKKNRLTALMFVAFALRNLKPASSVLLQHGSCKMKALSLFCVVLCC